MFRLTRPLFSAATKRTTGIVGLRVHQDPLPALKQTYEATLQTLSAIPQTSVYRQGTEALTLHKLKVLERANGDVTVLEKELDEGHIEESLEIAQDELSVANKMLEWKAWEPLEEKPEPGQWQYFGNEATASTSS
ncbi:NADH2 dehydrogenase [Cerioporus squamosus]|nr:NADH2 dehydrogenase [Cerioporus squamosus]